MAATAKSSNVKSPRIKGSSNRGSAGKLLVPGRDVFPLSSRGTHGREVVHSFGPEGAGMRPDDRILIVPLLSAVPIKRVLEKRPTKASEMANLSEMSFPLHTFFLLAFRYRDPDRLSSRTSSRR